MTRTVTVVGGGAIGLATAWRLALREARVVVVDPDPGRGATDVAAGMLAPVTEVHYGEEPLLALNLESARRWPAFVTELEAASGTRVGFRDEGTLGVAMHEDDLRALDALVRFQAQLQLPVEPLRSSACRARTRARGSTWTSPRTRAPPRTRGASDGSSARHSLLPSRVTGSSSWVWNWTSASRARRSSSSQAAARASSSTCRSAR